MFRSLLLSLVLAVVLLFMLMSLPMALSEAQTSPASAGPAPEGDEAYVAPAPVLAPAMGMPASALPPAKDGASWTASPLLPEWDDQATTLAGTGGSAMATAWAIWLSSIVAGVLCSPPSASVAGREHGSAEFTDQASSPQGGSVNSVNPLFFLTLEHNNTTLRLDKPGWSWYTSGRHQPPPRPRHAPAGTALARYL